MAKTVGTLREYLPGVISNPWRIVVADNGSEDGTPEIARRLSQEHSDVAWTRLEQRGRGRALRQPG